MPAVLIFIYISKGSSYLKKIIIFLPVSVLFIFTGCITSFYSYPNNTNLPVHFIKQKSDVLCGLAAAEMIADFYSMTLNCQYTDKITLEAQATDVIKGDSLKTMLENSGFDVAVFSGTTDNKPTGIFHYLSLNRPLIALISDTKGSFGHYVVIAGYTIDLQKLIIIDPAYGQETLLVSNFVFGWKNEDFFTLLAIPAK